MLRTMCYFTPFILFHLFLITALGDSVFVIHTFTDEENTQRCYFSKVKHEQISDPNTMLCSKWKYLVEWKMFTIEITNDQGKKINIKNESGQCQGICNMSNYNKVSSNC